ncbi:MAG: tetratricopeptide repeat protein [Proteobacteria bacterium]|nr:tetratricopeptide repeat protein [Pseudomonadota bacterium]
MKHSALLSVLFVSTLSATTANALVGVGAVNPDRPANNVEMIYSTNPALQCYYAARDSVDLHYGLEHCDIAMRDPHMNYRSKIVLNRGIIRYAMGDRAGALRDFRNAIEYDPSAGDAYLTQAQVLVADGRPADALAAINQGIALGAKNLHVAYYSRGEIEEDAGNVAQAYRDYKRALTIKPDYAPALRQLERFKVVPRNIQTP